MRDDGQSLEQPESLPHEALAAPAFPDPLKELRELKRRVQLGVYGCIVALVPFYVFVLPLSRYQFLAVYGFSLVIAFTAIEFAFSQMAKLRKRSAYPGVLVLQLGGVPSSAAACRAGLAVLDRLLKLRGSFLCLLQNGSLSLVAFSGLSRLQADQFLRLAAGAVDEALRSSEPVRFQSGSDLLSQAILSPGGVLVLVPVHSLQRAVGVVGLLAREGDTDVKDRDLLVGMGVALGLSLESLRQTEELRELAAMDELTGVYNRRYFFSELNREMAAAARQSAPLAVAILDVDGLKAINDRLGHAAGDELLRAIAMRLVRYSRAADLVARVGGDEFALILSNTDSAAAQTLAARLQHAVEREPVVLADGQELAIAVSSGTAAYPADAADAEALVRRADAVMYCVKAARRPAPKP